MPLPQSIPGQAIPGQAIPGQAIPGQAIPGQEVDSTVDCLVAFGANQGDCAATFQRVLDELRRMNMVGIRASVLFRTSPVGGPNNQDDYQNAAIRFRTSQSAAEVAAVLQHIELTCGRTRELRWGPRAVDLDLLLYGQSIIREPNLEVPHPRMKVRRFVLEPACQVASDFVHPCCALKLGNLFQVIRQATPRTALWLTLQPEKIAHLIEQLDRPQSIASFPDIQMIDARSDEALEKMSRIAIERNVFPTAGSPPVQPFTAGGIEMDQSQSGVPWAQWHILMAKQKLQLEQYHWRPGLVLTDRSAANDQARFDHYVHGFPGASMVLSGDLQQLKTELMAALAALDAFWFQP